VKNAIFTPDTTTTYILYATNGFCENWDTITINVENSPEVIAGPDVATCIGQGVGIVATGNAASYEWSGGMVTDTTALTTIALPQITTIYTITGFSPNGCTSEDVLTVTVNDLPSIIMPADQTICQNDTILLDANTSGTGFSWSPPARIVNPSVEDALAFPMDNTTFTLHVTDVNGCENEDVVNITVNPAPGADADAFQKIYLGEKADLTGTSATGGVTYQWSPVVDVNGDSIIVPPGSPTDPNITVRPPETTTFTLTTTDANGCRSYDTVTIVVVQEGFVSVPNAFTPNNDGLNDIFNVYTRGKLDLVYFRIFNRWGQLIFEGSKTEYQCTQGDSPCEQGWDGTFKGEPQQAGSYTYVVMIRTSGMVPQDVLTKGNVTLIR
jgi:gliding motility-associated-like protein